MINWKAVVIGFILAIVLGIAFGAVAGTVGSYIGVILAGVVVGYMVNKDVMNGITHGALIGVIGGIILAILVAILAAAIGGAIGAIIAVGGAIAIIAGIIIWAVLGAIGGAIGAMITGRTPEARPMGERGQMKMGEMGSKVEFNMENIAKCMCTQCPVQAESACAQNKLKMMQKMQNPDPSGESQVTMQKMMPKAEDVPGMYCATGKATCGDLDASQMCNCANCDIWKENDLGGGEPGSYFCTNGKAR